MGEAMQGMTEAIILGLCAAWFSVAIPFAVLKFKQPHWTTQLENMKPKATKDCD